MFNKYKITFSPGNLDGMEWGAFLFVLAALVTMIMIPLSFFAPKIVGIIMLIIIAGLFLAIIGLILNVLLDFIRKIIKIERK